MDFLLFGLGAIAAGAIEHATGNVCDGGYGRIRNIIANRRIDPNHDIEKAILAAHYQALDFVIKGACSDYDLDAYGADANNARGALKLRRESIAKKDFADRAPALAENWRSVIPDTFPDEAGALPVVESYLDNALADLKALTAWSADSWAKVERAARAEKTGWAPLFKAKLHEALKSRGPFREIYTQHVLKDQSDKLDRILDEMMPAEELRGWMEGVDKKLDELLAISQRIEDMLRAGFAERGLANRDVEIEALKQDALHLQRQQRLTHEMLKRFLKIALPTITITDGHITESLENLFGLILKEREQYAARKKTDTNDPETLKALRDEISAFLEDFDYDAARQAVHQARAKDQGGRAQSARDEALFDIEVARIEITALRTLEGMALLKQAASTLERYDWRQAWQWRMDGASAGYDRSLISGDRVIMQLAISYYGEALELALADLENDPPATGRSEEWATTKNNLGNALSTLGERGDDGALQKAINAYEDALKEWTRDKVPLQWAATKNNLGAALSTLGERGDDAALQKAINAYEDALKERTRDKVPLDWAMTKNNLGNALSTLGRRGDDAALEKAINAYEDALKEWTRDKVPLDWAMTKNNLGAALQTLGERGDDAALEKAITAYEDALKERTRDKVPLDWAMTKNNLGGALYKAGKRGRAEACFREALAAFWKLNHGPYIAHVVSAMKQRGFDPDA